MFLPTKPVTPRQAMAELLYLSSQFSCLYSGNKPSAICLLVYRMSVSYRSPVGTEGDSGGC